MTVYAHNRILPVRVENIPEELMARPQWVVWHAVGAKPDKVPYSVRTGRKASSTDLMTWSSFEEALEAYENAEYVGLGFVFSSADPYTGIDVDNCVDVNLYLRAISIEMKLKEHLELVARLEALEDGLTTHKQRTW